ncbi:hypothetical protein ACJMK2_013855 [Sinanodonta woodiana]|uniref:non-specific serine/threonine protein kinase n=1 Tax=Sinanodonta woodiana TaxID=1069815 RepID=A0ABD3V032_SINWO
MATGGQTENVCSLINVEGITLQGSNIRPWYDGIVVVSNKIFVIDWSEVRIHGLQDGRLLHESERLESSPMAACLTNDSEIAVLLDIGLIKIMSTHDTPVIRWSRDLLVRGGLDRYHGVVSFKGDLVVCGVKENTVCWCMVSSNDGRVVGTIHRIYKVKSRSLSSITAKHNMIYISCYDADSPDNNTGVYAYDVQDPSKYKYIYKHEDLKLPTGIAVDQHGSLFVCNYYPYHCIHHLTSECRLVSIITQGIPRDPVAIFCDDGHLYITSRGSNHITIYRTQYPVIPSEVLNMEPGSIEIYRKALSNGKEKVYNIRIMVVGPYDVGKTTLTKRLLGKDVNICDRQSTEGICIQTECCTVSLATREWITQEQNAEQYLRLQWLVKLFNEQVQHKSSDKEQMPKEIDTHVITENQDNIPAHHDVSAKTNHDIDENIMPTLSQPVESPIAISIPESSSDIARENEKKDAVMEIIQLVNANSDKLVKSMEEYAKVGMWDFAGQYVFYTTHQTFLSYRAIYLLVIDLSQQITALIQDECFIDTAGLKLCQVQETIDTWMNLIHSCTPSPQSGIPAVILVGTHLDKIPERYRHEVCEKYFTEIRSYLKDKPTILHLVNEDFAIDNTVVDSSLVALKQKIVEVASQQPYWGEEVPARWILLEREVTRLKVAGIKVIPRTLLEAFNQAEDVPIPTEELELFLKFQNDIGTILYFSIEVLKDKIVLVPQWMVDAIKSLITAKTLFVLRNAPAVAKKWDMFNKSGKLYPELIDAIWTKETYPDLHDNKEHILLLMEHLNIIARPRCFSDDGSDIKVDNYFLVPYLQGNADFPCHFHDVHVITSQDVLKFWFQKEEPSDVGSSTDRFMCIAYLLVDVGSRVLRQLLSHHTVTPTCTLDQYLAKHRNTINSLKRVFNQSQMDIMFPQNHVSTNLDDYDLTLLSAIFQNIVPALSQPEMNMIKRLREERNKLYGHAKSCYMSLNDFQTYWNDISSILTILSQQCGDTAFEAKILQEIQRTKVSAIPAGSYLDMLKTWFERIETVEGVLQNMTARLQELESSKKNISK